MRASDWQVTAVMRTLAESEATDSGDQHGDKVQLLPASQAWKIDQGRRAEIRCSCRTKWCRWVHRHGPQEQVEKIESWLFSRGGVL